MGVYNKTKKLVRRLSGHEVWSRSELTCPIKAVHNWCICPVGIDCDSTVFSLGIGNDIGFDTGMIELYGTTVHAFDPTPRWVKWIGTLELPEQFHFHPYAIGNRDGEMRLYPRMPKGRKSTTMMTLVNEGASEDEGIIVPVRSLRSLVRQFGVESVDILKMDIEAAEYDVIDDFLENGVPVYQLLVEFHHRFRSVPVKKTRDALESLFKKGYRIFYISEKAREYSLIHLETYERYLSGNVG